MWNIFKVNNKDTRTTSLSSFWCLYCYLWTYFSPSSSVSIVDFDQVNVFQVHPSNTDFHQSCEKILKWLIILKMVIHEQDTMFLHSDFSVKKIWLEFFWFVKIPGKAQNCGEIWKNKFSRHINLKWHHSNSFYII